MTDHRDDDLVREALTSEANRARPDQGAWSAIEARVGGRGRSTPRVVGAAAAAFVALIAAAVALTVWDRPDEERVATQPPPTTETTTTSEADPPTTETTTGTTQPEGDPVVDPIDMGPTPPTRDDRPDTIVAVLPDGWLVTVDTETGQVLEQHEWGGDLRDDSPEGGPYGIWQVAVAADGSSTWHSRCCEPAAGSIRRTGSSEYPVLDADNPVFTMTSRWLTAASYFAHVRRTDQPMAPTQHRTWWSEDVNGMSAAVLSPDGARLVVEPWPAHDIEGRVIGRNPMLVVRTDTVRRTVYDDGTVSDQIVDDDPRELPSDRWTLPTFRRDGLLLVAEEGDDGSWTPRLVDIETFEVTDAGFDYGPGVPVMQRFDGSGEWLLVLVVDDPDAFPAIGRLHWYGPDGRSGTIPGAYVSAAW